MKRKMSTAAGAAAGFLTGKSVRAAAAGFLTGKSVRAAAAGLLAGLSVLAAAASGGPGTVMTALAAERPEDMDDATWNRLQDHVLEYDEIEDLIVCYNPVYQQVNNSIQPSIDVMTEAAGEYREDAREAKKDAESAKESGDAMNQMILEATAAGEREAAKEMEKAADSIRRSGELGLNQTRKQLTSAVQQMIIGYHQVAASLELAETGAELAQAAYEAAQTQERVGMATDADVRSAQTSALSARNQVASLNDTMTSLKQNICLMTGWTYDADMTIGEVPAPDLTRIDAMDPEKDYDKALAYNYEISNAKKSPFGRGDANASRTFRTWGELEGKLRTALESLYQTVLQNRESYQAADTALRSAGLTMDGNERRYQLGMIGRLEYLQARVAYLQQKMAADNAALALTQAMENYDWALEGIVTLE